LFGQDGADEADERMAVGEDPDDVGAATDLAVEAFLRVVRPDLTLLANPAGCGRDRLALVSVLQFVESLSDRQAADAVRGRIDWKYALGLEISDAGFNFSVLSEFRTRLADGHTDQVLAGEVPSGTVIGERRPRSEHSKMIR
jgi:hypothetical protein